MNFNGVNAELFGIVKCPIQETACYFECNPCIM